MEMDSALHVNNDIQLGYTWSAQSWYGIVEIEEYELFMRVEFEHLPQHATKVFYAMNMGWRYNVDNRKWYRLKGY